MSNQPTVSLRGRLMQIAGAVVNTIVPPPSLPELDADTVETEQVTRARHRRERLDRKWIQITASFSRWVSDMFSDIPKGEINDPANWETKYGTDGTGRSISWSGIKGSYSISIGGTEVCLENIQFVVQGWSRIGGGWVFIDDDSVLDAVASNHLRYGVVANDGQFVEVYSQKHLATLFAHGEITV